MKKNLLRYLSVISLGIFLISCEEDDKITDNFPPEEGVNFTIKPLQLNQTVDVNGNTFVSSGILTVDADISESAPEGYSKQVLIQIVKWENGEEVEITKGAEFNLNGNGVADAKTFTLNFDNIVDEQTELNLAANILEAGSNRKLKGEGIIVNVETEQEDLEIAYKIKSITWDSEVDKNGDGFFAQRNISFIVATEGEVQKTLIGNVYLINDTDEDTTNIFQTGQFEVRREGFSNNELTFNINNADTLIRSGYEIYMTFSELENPDVIIFDELFKAADFVRIGFEPVLYDNREYTFPNQPGITWVNENPYGYYDSFFVNFDVKANVDLDYVDLDNTGEEFGLLAPFARLLYRESGTSDYLRLGDSLIVNDPFEAQRIGFFVSDLLPLNAGDSGVFDFAIQIVEPAENYFNSVDDVAVAEINKDNFPGLGDVRIKIE